MQLPGAQTRIVGFPSTEEFPIPAPNAVLACGDIQETYQELVDRGVEFSEPPTKQHGGVFAKFSDPDGNEFVLAEK